MYLSSRNVFAMQVPVAHSLGSQLATCGKDGPKDLHIVEWCFTAVIAACKPFPNQRPLWLPKCYIGMDGMDQKPSKTYEISANGNIFRSIYWILDTCQKICIYHYISVLIAVHISTFHILPCFTKCLPYVYHVLPYFKICYIVLPYFYTILPYFSICLPYVYNIFAICSPYFNTFYNVLPYIYIFFYHSLHYFSIFLPYVNHIFTIFLPYVIILKHSWYLTSRLTRPTISNAHRLGVNVLTLPIALPFHPRYRMGPRDSRAKSRKRWDTLWLCQNSYWKWPFIVDFPIKNGDFP